MEDEEYDDYDDDYYEDEEEEIVLELKIKIPEDWVRISPYSATDYSRETLGKIEEDRERARNALLAATDRTMSTFMVTTPKTVHLEIDGACHASLSIPKDVQVIASCFEARDVALASRKINLWSNGKLHIPFEGVAEKYWEWMTGDNSPWRTLFQKEKPEAIRDDDGVLIGFFLEPQLASTYPLHVLNYCIAMRMIGEERETLKMWDRLVKSGMHEGDALYLSRMVSEVDDSELVTLSGNHNNTSHWPLSHVKFLSANKTFYFSFDRFRNGNPRFNDRTNEIAYWCDSPEYPDFSFAGIKKEKEDRRAYIDYFKLEDVISAFYAWQEKHGQSINQKRKAA
jgi:hypothetical protein